MKSLVPTILLAHTILVPPTRQNYFRQHGAIHKDPLNFFFPPQVNDKTTHFLFKKVILFSASCIGKHFVYTLSIPMSFPIRLPHIDLRPHTSIPTPFAFMSLVVFFSLMRNILFLLSRAVKPMPLCCLAIKLC